MIGTRLIHYEITNHLGTGGMGEVYQATDSKLGRNVAIKLLPEVFARDAERAARFEREARVLASLNHPRIAQIYGIEEAGGRKFLVMELIAGETLADRISRGSLPLDEVLKIGAQIAEALESAQERGIIHRDLKPANIKFAADGQAKVLDFGLAKAFDDDVADANLSNSPTLISVAASNAGIILGTAAYMSPEQAKGMPVDARSDIFSFGCVFYEMLTGRTAFAGETVSDILADVIRADVDFSQLPPNTPPAVRRLLARCLRKDRKRRLQTAADLRNELEDAMQAPDETSQTATPVVTPRRSWIPWVATFASLAIAGIFAVPYFRGSAPAPELRLEVTTPATDDLISFAVSPNGRYLTFVASGDGTPRLWVRQLDTLTSQPLQGTEGATYPFWSPDSKSIGFSAGGKLLRVDVGGGLPQTLVAAGGYRGGSWSSEGVIVFAPGNSSPLMRVSASGGETAAVTKLEKRQNSHRFPSFLPNGRQFLFFSVGTGGADGIYLGSLDSTDSRLLTAADTAGAYMEPGWLLYLRQGTLLARRLDESKGTLTGETIKMADPVSSESSIGLGAFSVSRTGMVAYRSGSGARRQLTWFDRSGKALGTLGAPDSGGLTAPSLAPDGNRAAAFRISQSNSDVYIFDSVRTTRFTSDASLDRYPIWSHDGRRIVFDSNRNDRRNIYWGPYDQSGREEILLESDEDKVPNDMSSDGRFLLFISLASKTGADLMTLPIDEKGKPGKPVSFLRTPFEERQGQFSPDVQWVAYESTESGSGYEVYVRPFPGPGGQYQISTGGGVQPRWRSDGKELYYLAPDGKLMAVTVDARGGRIDPGKPSPLFQTKLWGGGSNAVTNQQYAVSRDGRFLMNVTADDAQSTPITILLNWKPPTQ